MADGKVKIDVELTKDKFEKELKNVEKDTSNAFKRVGDSSKKYGKSLADIAAESGKTVNQLRSEVMKSAAAYQKAGMTQSEAIKKAYADIGYSADQMSEKLNKGEQAVGKLSTTMKTVLVAAATVGAVALGKMATAGLRFNADMEMYTTNFRVMLGSQEEAVKKVEQLQKMAAKTPFELGDLANATQTLLAFNVASEDTQGILQMLGDISLGNADKLNSLTYAYGKMQAAQKVTLEDLNIMIERGFNPLSIIAEQTGETMQEVYDRVSKGAVSVDEITNAMKIATSEGGQFFNGMEEASKTFNGQLSTLKDNFNELLGNATKPLFNFLTNTALPGAIELVGFLNDHINTLIATLGGMSAAVGTAFAVKKIQAMTTFVGLLTGQIKLATVATTLWSKAMAFLSANKFVLIAAAIVGIATALGVAASQAGGFGKLFDGIADKIVSITDKAGEFITQFAKSVAENAPQIFEALTVALSEGLPALAQSGVQILQTLIDSISQNLPMLIELGVTIITGLIDSFTTNLPMIMNAAVTIITGLITGITQNLPKLVAAAIQLITALIQGISQALPTLISAAPQIIISLVKGIISALPTLIAAAPQIIAALVKGILGALSSLVSAGKDMLNSVKKGIKNGIKGMASIGKDIISGLWNGISDKVGWLKDKVSGALSGVKDFIAGIFDVNSPSKWMQDFIGKNMMIGWGLGITKNVKQVTNAMKTAGKEVQGKALSFSPRSLGVATANQGGGYVVDNRVINQNFYNKQTSPYDAYRKVVRGFAY